jgi:hypothetical protein
MAWNEPGAERREITLNNMQVGTTYAAGENAKEKMSWPNLWFRHIFYAEV